MAASIDRQSRIYVRIYVHYLRIVHRYPVLLRSERLGARGGVHCERCGREKPYAAGLEKSRCWHVGRLRALVVTSQCHDPLRHHLDEEVAGVEPMSGARRARSC